MRKTWSPVFMVFVAVILFTAAVEAKKPKQAQPVDGTQYTTEFRVDYAACIQEGCVLNLHYMDRTFTVSCMRASTPCFQWPTGTVLKGKFFTWRDYRGNPIDAIEIPIAYGDGSPTGLSRWSIDQTKMD